MQNNERTLGIPNDLFPITLHEGVHVVDSRLIAKELGIEHQNFFATIHKYQSEVIGSFGVCLFQTDIPKKQTKGGKPQKYALLNENQATFLATLSRNTPQVVAFKAKLVLSFAEVKQDFSKIYALWHELMQTLQADEENYNNTITAIEDAFAFVLKKCTSLGADITALQTEMKKIYQEQQITKQILTSFSQQIQAQQTKIDILSNNQNQEKGVLSTTVERVDKIEERLDFKAVAHVYVMYCPRKQWYKLGSSHDAKGRKRVFSTIEPHLLIKFEIPTVSREAAYSLENMLKKYFANRHKEGEWYALTEEDLTYLQTLQQSNTSHLLKTA